MAQRRTTALKVSGVLFGTLLLAGIGVLILFRLHVERRWDAMERRCLELGAELPRGPGRRPALRSHPLPGDAREDYKAAIAAAEPFSFADSQIDSMPFLPFHDGAPTSEADFQKSLEPVISPLRSGAARESFQRVSALDLHPGPEDIDYPYAVVRIAACRARHLGRQGNRHEAAEVLFDACRFASDLGIPHLVLPPLTALSDLLKEEALARTDSAEIARKLAMLETELPRRATEARWMLLLMGKVFLQTRDADLPRLYSWGVPETPVDWHFGWSLRLLLADGFRQTDHLCRDLERRDGLGWPAACAEWGVPLAPSTLLDNPIPGHFEYIEVPVDLRFREIAAKVGILRVAAHYRATGEILSLPDPFGSAIQTRKTGSRLRVWSAGNSTPLQLYRFQAREVQDLRFHPQAGDAEPGIVLEILP